jgi:hypothetical protein
MVTPTCPKCHGTVPGEDINVSADVAYCRVCNIAYKLSELAPGSGIDPNIDLSQPPKGAWHRASGLGTVIGATHRAVGGALAAFAFAAFWNGILSVFLALVLSSTLTLLGFEPPHWFPKPIMNGGAIGVGMTIFLWIFLTPFMAVGLAMIAAFLSCLGGKTEVRLRDWQGEVFTGIGSVGFKRKFKPDQVKAVRIEDRQWRDSDGDRRRSTHIMIDMIEGKAIKFGSSLTNERRQYIAAALREAIKR